MIETEGIIKPTKKELKQIKKERKKRIRQQFKSMNSCMINPSDIKIGKLKRCIDSKYISHLTISDFAGELSFGHIEEEFEPIAGEKILIKVDPKEDFYVDLAEINNNKDLRSIRKSIDDDGLIIDEKILTYFSGKIRVCKETLRNHPYLEDELITKPINIKKLKKYLKA